MNELNLVGIFSDAFWYVAPIIVTLTTTVTGLINRYCKIEKNIFKQLISWGVASVLSVVAWLIKVITFGPPVWLGVIALCVVTGLSSNGFYDIEVIKNFIKKWFPEKVAVEK